MQYQLTGYKKLKQKFGSVKIAMKLKNAEIERQQEIIDTKNEKIKKLVNEI